MTGERDLDTLLASLTPAVRAGEFVFVTLPDAVPIDCEATIREDEGLTGVVPRQVADDAGWHYDLALGWITLQVHSALDAVGLTAEVARALTDRGISCNVLAGRFHDHLLVPLDRVDEAVAALRELSASARPATGSPDAGRR